MISIHLYTEYYHYICCFCCCCFFLGVYIYIYKETERNCVMTNVINKKTTEQLSRLEKLSFTFADVEKYTHYVCVVYTEPIDPILIL